MFSAFIGWTILFVFLRPDVPVADIKRPDVPVVDIKRPDVPVMDINEGAWLSYRLPTSVKPVHYDIQLFPDMYSKKSATFEGEETITVQVINSTRYILLHISGINIISTSLRNRATYTSINVERAFRNWTTNMWIIKCKETLQIGINVDIFLRFSGLLGDNMRGLYKHSYNIPEDNRTRYMVATQFEAVAARGAFPCFDEPSFKAFYTMRLVHKRSHRALFNSMETSITNATFKHSDGDDLVVTQFNKTEYPMSTYIVAMAVVESYDYVTRKMTDGRLMRFFGPQYKISELKYAADFTPKARAYLEKLLDMKSPLRKLDSLAVTTIDGAMENWGLIKYEENYFLLPSKASDEVDFMINTLISHELSHTWFGNIVTMAWWDELWLKESFASYFESIVSQKLCPKWKAVSYTQFTSRHIVMFRDTDLSISVPIIQSDEIRTDDEVEKMFSDFVYSKGGIILTWVEQIMGPEKFFSGLRSYLKANKYSTGSTKSLFSHWDKSSAGQYSAAEIMNGWLRQSGYPIVSLQLSSDKGSLVLSQKSVFIAPNVTAAATAPYNSTWWIDVKIRTNESNTSIHSVLTQSEKQKTLLTPSLFDANRANSWIMLNSDSFGYYRSHYDPVLFKRLVDAISNDPDSFDEMQRAYFIDDTIQLGKLGEYTASQVLSSTLYLHKESSFPVWTLLSTEVIKFDKIMKSNMFRKYMLNKTKSLFPNWNKTGNYPKSYQSNLFFQLSCRFEMIKGNGPCLNYTKLHFLNWVQTSETIPLSVELHDYVYFYGLKQNNTEENWRALFNLYQSSDTDEATKEQALFGLTGDTSRFEELLPAIFTPETEWLTMQDAFYTFAKDDMSRERLWNWTVKKCFLPIIDNSTELSDFCFYLLQAGIEPLNKQVSTKEDADKVTTLLAHLSDNSFKDIKERVLKTIKSNKMYAETIGKTFERFLNSDLL